MGTVFCSTFLARYPDFSVLYHHGNRKDWSPQRPPPSHDIPSGTDLWRHWRGRPCSHVSGSLVEPAIPEENGHRMGNLMLITNFILVFYGVPINIQLGSSQSSGTEIKNLRKSKPDMDRFQAPSLWERGGYKIGSSKIQQHPPTNCLFANETLSITP